MATFGGTVRFTYDGSPLVMRGHIMTTPSNVKAEAIPNQDGSISRSLAPNGYRAKPKFEDSTNGAAGLSLATPQPWDAIIKGGPYNITVVEEQTGITHMWTSAMFVGEPSVDRETGEVDGLEIVAQGYSFGTF